MVKNRFINYIISGIRQGRGQIITIALLFSLAAALMNAYFFFAFDYKKSFYKEKERIQAEDLSFLLVDTANESTDKEKLENVFADIDSIKEFEINEIIYENGSISFNDGSLTKNLTFIDYDKAMEKKIGPYEILESDGGSGVYLSYLFKIDGGYKIGDKVTVTIGHSIQLLRIAGFYNSISTGTTNCIDIAILMTKDCGAYLPSNMKGYRVSVNVCDLSEVEVAESLIGSKISEKLPAVLIIGSSNIDKVAESRYITANIFIAVIGLGTILITLVVLCIIAITLSNYVRNNTRNLGTLKAIGYTSYSLIVPIVVEFSVIGFVMSLAGSLSSYALFPVLNNALEKQTGIPYVIRILPECTILSIIIPTFLGALVSYLSVVRIRYISPIQAIRDRYRTLKIPFITAFRLDKTRFHLNTALALRTGITAPARNLVLFFSMTAISFLLGFTCFCYQNIIVDQGPIMNLICGEVTDSVVGVSSENESKLRDNLATNPNVERFYMYTISLITPENSPKVYTYVMDNFDTLDTDRICIKGRMPVDDTEMTVNSAYAKDNGLKVGDKLTFTNDGEIVALTITGIHQGAYNAGRDAYMLRSAYEKIAPLLVLDYNIDLKDGININSFNIRISTDCDLWFANNFKDSLETISESYIRILNISNLVISVLSFLTSGFIIYILITIFLANRQREHGILKSLGFVTRDIIYHTVVGTIPPCLFGIILGLLLSKSGIGRLLAIVLENIGIVSLGSTISFYYLLLAGLFLLIITVLFTIVLSARVRKITPHRLFNRE